jgi:hypothetical protein
MFVWALKSGGFVAGVWPHCHWKDRRIPTAMETAETDCVAAMRTTELGQSDERSRSWLALGSALLSVVGWIVQATIA